MRFQSICAESENSLQKTGLTFLMPIDHLRRWDRSIKHGFRYLFEG
jgi:hypothetical protein